MKQDGKFILLNREELKTYITGLKNIKGFTSIQQHHTASPSYKDVKNNHFQLMKSMENYHVNTLKMSEIAQHFSTFPDGSICVGRPLTKDGGGFSGSQNINSITIENVGNFDIDAMTEEQMESIILLNVLLCIKFGIDPSTDTLPYHCWVKNKSCPGINFFGGNTKSAAEKFFIPLIKKEIVAMLTFEEALKIVAGNAGLSYQYWLKRRGIDPYFETLIIKIAQSYRGKYMDNVNAFKAAIVTVFTGFSACFGWFGWLVVIFISSMTGDLITGFLAAFKSGKWESRIAREGLWHKIGCVVAVLVTAIFDFIIGMIINNLPNIEFPFKYSVLLCPLAITWYVLTELGSIVENAGKLGAPIPGFFVKQALAIFKSAVDTAGDKMTENK